VGATHHPVPTSVAVFQLFLVEDEGKYVAAWDRALLRNPSSIDRTISYTGLGPVSRDFENRELAYACL
jgi:hypothetical protein